MLLEFSMKNFKNFNDGAMIFSLADNAKYNFNCSAMCHNAILNTAMIYGKNGSGKTNLGLGLYDIVLNLTNRSIPLGYDYTQSKNVMAKKDALISFSYKFKFDDHTLRYTYLRDTNRYSLVKEVLEVDGEEVAICSDRIAKIVHMEDPCYTGKICLKPKQSMINYIKENLPDNIDTPPIKDQVFKKFVKFVEGMYYFNFAKAEFDYEFTKNFAALAADEGWLDKYEKFLCQMTNIRFNLSIGEIDGNYYIFNKYGNKQVQLFDIGFNGLEQLTWLYLWKTRLNNTFDNVSFLYIDDFADSFDDDVAINVLNYLSTQRTPLTEKNQLILASHNTTLMSKDSLLNPNAYYVVEDGLVDSIVDLSDKEITREDDIEKLYKCCMFERSKI